MSSTGRPDLSGVIRLRRKVIAEQRGLGGESVTGELHAVAGVPGESDDDFLELLPRGGAGTGVTTVLTHDPAFHIQLAGADESQDEAAIARRADRVSCLPDFPVTGSTDYCTSLRLP